MIRDYGYVLSLAPEASGYAGVAAAAGINDKAFVRIYRDHLLRFRIVEMQFPLRKKGIARLTGRHTDDFDKGG